MESEAIFGNIVLRVHEDLNRLQEKLKSKESQDNINVSDIKELISNTQNGLQKRAEEILNHLNNRVTSSSTIENVNQKNKISAIMSMNQERFQKLQEINLQNDNKPMEIEKSPGENVKKEMALKSLSNPHNKMNRYFANEMYGIQLPLIHDKSTMKTPNLEAIQKGSMIKKLEKLPLETNKYFNNTKPSKITEIDAKRGLLNLIERGLIPPNAKIKFDPPPINNGIVPLLSASMKNRVIIPAGANDQGYSVACYHLDETGGNAKDYLDDDQAENTSIRPEKINSISNDKSNSGLPNVLNNVIKMQHLRPKDDSEDGHLKSKKSILLRSEKPINIKSIKTIQFNKEVEEKEVIKYMNNDSERNMTMPPPTTPASQLSKSNMDTCHKFSIKDGTVREATDDFIRFKRHYCLVWGGIVSIIKALERFLSKYWIPLAFINGDRVADLSVEYELELKPTEEELLSCIINRKDIINLLKKPGRRFMGKNKKECAALVIQSKYRSYIARKFYLEYRRKRWAAGVIAIQWILHMKMTHVKEELQTIRAKQLVNFKIRYQELSNKWTKYNTTRRVIIHLPSFGLTETHRLKLKKLPEMQNHQMTRLCDLMDNNVDVIYISPVPMNEEILQYYSKLLALKSAIETGNSNDQKPLNSRYKIIVPEAIKSFPNHNMCLSTILKYSPRALGRIKNMIKGRVAWIVPGMMHIDDIYVGDLLNVPILGTEPGILEIHKSKSEIRKLFEYAKVDMPPGECEIISLTQLHESFTQLIIDNLNIKRWVFKTNYDIKSQGIAYIDIDVNLSCYSWAQKEQKRYGEKWKKKWAQENAYNRILREIPDIIEKNLIIIDQKFYSHKSKYLKELFAKGGVIEAFPGSESVTNLTVNMFIDPTGNIQMIGSGDQIHDGNPLNAWGYSVPQSSIDSEIVNGCCFKIAEYCKRKEIKGYFSIDFVTFIENNEENQLLWAVDIDFQYSDLASLLNLSEFTTNTQFKYEDHSLSVNLPVQPSTASAPLSRFVCLSSQLSHSNLSMVHYSVFFQMCRAHGIGFDLKEKQGTIFSLIDSFNRENISMVTIGTSLENALESFGKNLYILHQEISSPNMAGHGNFQVVIKEIENILGLAIENSNNTESKSK